MFIKHTSNKRKTLFFGISLFLLNAMSASAAVVLTITAESSSATQITITGSGTNTVDTAVTSNSVQNGRLPVGSSWNGSTGNMNITDLDSEFHLMTSNFVVNGTSTLQYTHNGSPFGNVLNEIETYNTDPADHEFRVGPSALMTYPAMSIGDTYGFTGSVTFDLSGGMTAAAFTNGSFDNPINGGDFTWAVSIVPEPSTYSIIFGTILLLAVGRRKLISKSRGK